MTADVQQYLLRVRVPLEPRHADTERSIELTISVDAGAAPRITICEAWDLELYEKTKLDEEIARLLAVLRVPCRCGSPWHTHDHDSPHSYPENGCRSFTAAAPMIGDDAR